jgi:hypothetical protein
VRNLEEIADDRRAFYVGSAANLDADTEERLVRKMAGAVK